MFLFLKNLVSKILRLHNIILLIQLPFSIIFTSFFILVLIILSPFILIRIGYINSDRIGHFAANTELYICEKKHNVNPINFPHVDIFFQKKKTCNTYLLKKWREQLIILPYLFPINFILNIITNIKFLNKFLITEVLNSDRDVLNLLDQYEPSIIFNNDEIDKAKILLNEMGISDNQKYICLIIRDSAYLKKFDKTTDWSYHNFRDSDINNYLDVCDYLTKKGYYVLRMGAEVDMKLELNNPRIIDYANSEYKSEFLDIYLGANCFFCISTGTGYDSIPMIFRKPIVYVNLLPFGYIPSYCKNTIALSKRFYSIKENKYLNLDSIFNNNCAYLLKTNEYNDAEIQLFENTSEEITAVVAEMEGRLTSNYLYSSKDKLLQEIFLNKFKYHISKYSQNPIHGEIRFTYSIDFLKKNNEFIL